MIQLGIYNLEIGEVKVLEGGLDSLLSIPPSVEPDKNDWGDEDGLEVDLLLGLQLEPHKAKINLYAPSREEGKRFVSYMMQSHIHRFVVYGREFDLRPIGYELKEVIEGRQEIELNAVVNERRHAVQLPNSYNPLSRFIVLEGSEQALYRYTSIKEGHSNRYQYIGGDRVLSKNKDIELYLFLSVNSWQDLWLERDILRQWLTAPNLRLLNVDGVTLEGYYRQLRTIDFCLDGSQINWSFSTSFCITK